MEMECIRLALIFFLRTDHIMNDSDPPIINIREMQVPVDVGETKTMRCEVDSNPPAQVQWSKAGSQYMVLSREEK